MARPKIFRRYFEKIFLVQKFILALWNLQNLNQNQKKAERVVENMARNKRTVRNTLTCTINPDIIEILNATTADYFYTSRSKFVERILLDWLEENEVISQRDRILLENCYREGWTFEWNTLLQSNSEFTNLKNGTFTMKNNYLNR